MPEDPVAEEEKNPSSTPQNPGNENNEFSGKKRKKPKQGKAKKPAENEAGKPNKMKRKMMKKKSNGPKESGLVNPPSRQRKRTNDGLTIYTEEEMGNGRADAGEFMDITSNPEAGPAEAPLLCLPHRSDMIWTNQDITSLTCRRGDSGLWDTPLDTRVLRYLIRAGFYGAYRVGFIRLDHALITALVERWREETHTFHLPIGESTVTLQDVSVLLGLPVDGPPIMSFDQTRTVVEWQQLCEELLGLAPEASYLSAGRLKVKWLIDHFGALPAGATEEHIRCYARAYILWLIGGALMPDKSQNLVKLMYLPLLRDLDECGTLSWGSAVLATLYRMLCRATKVDVRDIGGPLVLLQIWAWERFPRMAPRRLHEPTEGQEPIKDGDQHLPAGPWGCRWRVKFALDQVSTHVVTVYRDQFDRLQDNEFTWQPYGLQDEVIESLPDYCRSGREIWLTRSPLICYDIIEWHLPHRVLRQFGHKQSVPDRFDTDQRLHAIDRRGRANTDWSIAHDHYRTLWMDRRANIVLADRTDEPMEYNDPYMQWFRRMSHPLIGNPTFQADTGYQGAGGMVDALAHCVAEDYGLADRIIRTGDGSAALQALAQIRDRCYDTLHRIRLQQRLPLGHDGETPLHHPGHDEEEGLTNVDVVRDNTDRGRNRAKARGRGRGRGTEAQAQAEVVSQKVGFHIL